MSYDYGWWPLVALHVGLGLAFALSYLKPARRREWRSFGVLTAFLVALYTEMYGFPLTIYLLTTLLGRAPFPEPFAHASGNLIASLLGLGENWAALFMGLGGLLMLLGVVIVALAWRRIYAAGEALVTDGPYAVVRHPQYSGLLLVLLGALVQWPTLITLSHGAGISPDLLSASPPRGAWAGRAFRRALDYLPRPNTDVPTPLANLHERGSR